MTNLTVAADGLVLTTDPGTMRLILEQARICCQSAAMAPSVSSDWKVRWGARASMLGDLVEQLPPPADPREPYGPVGEQQVPAYDPDDRHPEEGWNGGYTQAMTEEFSAAQSRPSDLDDLLG